MPGYTVETFHSLFIHFPIALLSTGFLSDILGSLSRRDSLHNAGWWCQVFGSLSLVFTIGTGFLADTVIGHMEEPFPLFETHGIVQIIASFIFVILLVWRFRLKSQLPEKPFLTVYYIVSGLAVMIMFYGAHLGAQLAGRI